MPEGASAIGDLMRNIARVAAIGVAAAVGIGVLAGPAMAKGGAVGGLGGQYFLNDSFTGSANTVFNFGDPGDDVYVGDWNGDGIDTLLVRRNNTFYVRNSNSS